ncbi:MAG: cysteine desulfurase [Clostridia bacterium]|nr:cysteine desulfurase [Clostridia bacterium]
MEVYLDNSATTKPYEEAVNVMCEVMSSNYANPSSLHRMGKFAEDSLNKSRETLAKSIGCSPNEFYFTSGGTESNNLAIIGYAMANKREGNRIITQPTEHAAVLEPFKYLESQGFEVCYVPVDSFGFPNINALKDLINDKTILLSFMYVNNENGAIFPIEEIASLKRGKASLHVDAVQGYGKLSINVKKQNIDMLSLSSHKIHGPNGIGGLYVKNNLKINPIVYGGSQEKSLRSGTENIASASSFAKAAEIKISNLEEDAKKMESLKQHLKEKLCCGIENVIINSPENSVCSILNVSFPGVKSEVLLHVLESKGIYVSTGSACNSKKKKYSYVLKEMNLKDNIIDSAVRFSFSSFNTIEEIDYTAEVLIKEIPLLRKIMK